MTDLWAVSSPEAAALASMKCHAATQGDIDYRTNFAYCICYRPVLPLSSSDAQVQIDQPIQQQGDRRNSLSHCIQVNVNYDTWTVIEIYEPIS